MICSLCPRKCALPRPHGFCAMPEEAVVARAALHFGEEPCISGQRGSGTIFFYGCNLRCVFCQNNRISREKSENAGKTYDAAGLRRLIDNLIEQGAHNINFVTPSHYTHIIREALSEKISVPTVYNCGGYESVPVLKSLNGIIDVYMPDIKYSSDELAEKYSSAKDYTSVVIPALIEMFRQRGRCRFDEDGMLKSGLLIRHLVLPGKLENTFGVIDMIKDTFPRGSVLVSLMGQYTPMPGIENIAPELARPLTREEYDTAASYLEKAGIYDGYLQEPDASGCDMIPYFE